MILVMILASCGISGVLAFHLGVRRERGRQHRRDQIMAESAPPRGGVRLRTMTVRR